MANTNTTTFTKLLPIHIRKDVALNMRDVGGVDNGVGIMKGVEQKEVIRVTIMYPSTSCGTMNPHKEIALRLTNDDDPSFFYYLRICDAEFPDLKSHQGLLVDFYGFPQQLLTLLDKCDPSSEESANESGPKFLLVLKLGIISVLDIVESNPFKYLCHLSLQINPGTDTEVKKYLCEVTKILKKDFQLLQEKYGHLASSMNSELSRTKSLVEEKTKELNDLKSEIHSQANTLASKHFQEMTSEKEKLLKLQSDLGNKFERDRMEMEKRQCQTALALEDRIRALETENRELLQGKFKNETMLQDTKLKIKNYEDDLKILQQELTVSRKQNGKLDHDYHEKQRSVNSLQNRLTTVEADLNEKNNLVHKQQDYIAKLSDQKKYNDDEIKSLLKDIENFKLINKNVSTELIKANEIIKKLQDDTRNLHMKSKLQNQIVSEQERTIRDRDRQIQIADCELTAAKSDLASKMTELGSLKEQLEKSEEKNESLEKNCKSNENMISWLNKQLNEFQGLSNLNKFRQNLAQNQNGQLRYGDEGDVEGDRGGPPAPLQTELNHISTSSINNIGLRKPTFYSRLSNQNNNNTLQSTLPGATPSWMHIYQSTSTSTPLDDDLSARLEQVTASQGIRHNLSGNKSRLETISEKSVASKPPSTSANNSANTTRPPTWTRGRGKVVFDAPVPSSRPNFRNHVNNK